jgi:hypothetical protein
VTNFALDLSPLFPDDDDGNPTYVRRYRPGSHKLITLDQSKKPRRAMLHYSQNYSGPYPAVWNGSGTWTQIPGGWTLRGEAARHPGHDQRRPEQWYVGKNTPELKGITWRANPPAGKQFFLMLTTVIDDDIMLPSVVPARVAADAVRAAAAVDAGPLPVPGAYTPLLVQPRDRTT